MLRAFSLGSAIGTLLLAGCAINSPAPEFAPEDDTFKPYTTVTSTPVRTRFGTPIDAQSQGTVAISLEARRDRQTGAISTQANIVLNYTSAYMRHYETARNAKAEALAVRLVKHLGRCSGAPCPQTEWITVDIPEADLRAARTSGYDFKIFARTREEHRFTLTATSLGKFLDEVDAHAAKVTAAQKG